MTTPTLTDRLLAFEQEGYRAVAALRDRVLLPVAKLLQALGLTPDSLGYGRVITMAVFAVAVTQALWVAVIFFMVSVASDWVDGVLARHLKQASERGRFIDLLCDTVSFLLFIVGLLRLGVLQPLTGAMYAYLVLLATVIRMVRNSLAGTRIPVFTVTVVGVSSIATGFTRLLFMVYVVWSVNYVEWSSWLFIAILVLEIGFSARLIAAHLPRRA